MARHIDECGDSMAPNQPVCGMGEIRFPTGTTAGSGDVVCGPKRRRKRVYKPKPARTIIRFEDFEYGKDRKG